MFHKVTLAGCTGLLAMASLLAGSAPAGAQTHHARSHQHVRHHARHHAKRARHHARHHARRHTNPQPTGAIVPAGSGSLPAHGGTAYSLNWSGYAVTPGNGVSAVASSFTVPTASLIPPGFAATWTGIGGYSTSDLIQAGAAESSLVSNPILGPQYYAWYELLPAGETQITGCSPDPNCTVKPGDQISVKISNAGGDSWTISMDDAGRWSYAKQVTYTSTESSAEWILEAPTVAVQTILANTGTTHFGPTSTYTRGGATNTIAQGNPTKIDLSPSPVGGLDEATPSALASDGQSFNDCAYQQSCPAP